MESGKSTTIYKMVSSAKTRMFELIYLTISIMNIKKRRGPGIELLGTPANISSHSNMPPGITTL